MGLNIKYKNSIIVENVILADNFCARLSGYMFRKVPHVSGILFEPAGAIQTTFMKFDLDLIFISQQNQILKIVRNMKPWRYAWSKTNAHKVLELPAGGLPEELKDGDILEILGGR